MFNVTNLVLNPVNSLSPGDYVAIDGCDETGVVFHDEVQDVELPRNQIIPTRSILSRVLEWLNETAIIDDEAWIRERSLTLLGSSRSRF